MWSAAGCEAADQSAIQVQNDCELTLSSTKLVEGISGIGSLLKSKDADS